MLVLVYDTETTGLPKKGITKPPCLEEEQLYPHIVQLSYIVYNILTNEIVKVYDNVIKIADDIIISEESIALHHINRDIMNLKGISIVDALQSLITDIDNVDVVVGHNISFDNKMILIEMIRNQKYFDSSIILSFLQSTKFYCTMMNSIELCAIKTFYKNSTKSYNKFPKLIELYTYLFEVTPTKLHNSLNDVVLCLQCFCKIRCGEDISKINHDIFKMIQDIM
jgi:DNA polymerase III epsilon subunit-like protein